MRGLTSTVCGIVLLAGCAAAPGADEGVDDTAGMGVPQQFPVETFPGDRRPLQLELHLAGNGCFLGSLERPGSSGRHLVVWPEGTEQGAHGDELLLPDGTLLRDGDLLTGQGLLMPTRRLQGFGGDSYWDFAVGFCTPDATHVLVLDSAAKR